MCLSHALERSESMAIKKEILDNLSLVSDTFHSKFNWLSSRGIFGSSSVSENS